jgi:sortase (surface protein transpeptidase)
MKKATTIILVVVLLAGCATTPTQQYKSKLTAKDYYETYYGKKTAERILQKETAPDNEQGTYPQEAESEEPDDKTTLGDVALGALKVLGMIVLVAIMLAGAAGQGLSGL